MLGVGITFTVGSLFFIPLAMLFFKDQIFAATIMTLISVGTGMFLIYLEGKAAGKKISATSDTPES